MGVLSIQSYSQDGFGREALQTLQALADHCAATLERILTQEQIDATRLRLGHLLAQRPADIHSRL
jgi:GAF domain-containing protein